MEDSQDLVGRNFYPVNLVINSAVKQCYFALIGSVGSNPTMSLLAFAYWLLKIKK